jgi:Tfp pilus assembly protein FimT
MVIVLVVVGVVMAIGLRPLNRQRQKTNARSARVEASQGLALARSAAISRGCVAVFHLQVTSNSSMANGQMWVTACKANVIGAPGAPVDTLGRVDTLSRRFGVTVTGAADSVRYDSRGFTVNYVSGAYAFTAASDARDTLTINSMGRVGQ